MKGTVKVFNSEKNYGFIKDEHGNEYFMHLSDVEGNSRVIPRKGQDVEFDYRDTPKGKRAIHIQLSN